MVTERASDSGVTALLKLKVGVHIPTAALLDARCCEEAARFEVCAVIVPHLETEVSSFFQDAVESLAKAAHHQTLSVSVSVSLAKVKKVREHPYRDSNSESRDP